MGLVRVRDGWMQCALGKGGWGQGWDEDSDGMRDRN